MKKLLLIIPLLITSVVLFLNVGHSQPTLIQKSTNIKVKDNYNFKLDMPSHFVNIDSQLFAPISNYYGEDAIIGDGVSGDSEEMNLLQAGISNLISTNSDMFTVHMRIRTFKRNPITGVWDATNLDYIVDDSRYVMLVDRSNVNSPSDKPRILYFEKLPN